MSDKIPMFPTAQPPRADEACKGVAQGCVFGVEQLFAGNLPAGMLVHCLEQVCRARDTTDWFSWERHRSHSQGHGRAETMGQQYYKNTTDMVRLCLYFLHFFLHVRSATSMEKN